MTNPIPEERAEALRLAEGWAARWTGHHPTGLAAEPLAMARALLATESERAELAREVEGLRESYEQRQADALRYASEARRAETRVKELEEKARAVILTYGTPQFADMLRALDEVAGLSAAHERQEIAAENLRELAEESSGD